MPIYVKYDGIDGGVTASGHEKWIEVDSCQLGVHRNVTNPTGRGTEREAAVPSLSEIVVTKSQDAASAKLFQASLWGEGHSRPMESLSLNYTKITYVATSMDKDNKTAKPDRAMWDLAQGKGS